MLNLRGSRCQPKWKAASNDYDLSVLEKRGFTLARQANVAIGGTIAASFFLFLHQVTHLNLDTISLVQLSLLPIGLAYARCA